MVLPPTIWEESGAEEVRVLWLGRYAVYGAVGRFGGGGGMSVGEVVKVWKGAYRGFVMDGGLEID